MPATPPLRVLIVEDDFLVREMIQKLLERAGYRILGMTDEALTAVAMTRDLRPDIVVMDVGLPGDLDGIDAAQRIAETCPTPIIVVTAYESPEVVARASAAGVGAYLTKPVTLATLERAITIAQARFKDIRELRRLNDELRAEAARRQLAEEEQQRITQELMTLYETALDLNAAPDLPVLTRIIAERAAQLLRARLCQVYLMQPNGLPGQPITIGAGDSHPALDPNGYLARLAGRAALNGQAVLPDGVQHEGHYFGRILGVPLQTGQHIVGVLVLADDQLPGPFSQHDFWLATLFADQAAIALENARLRAALQHELGERQQAQDTLRESEERYRKLIEFSPDAILVHHSGQILFANPAAATLLGAATSAALEGRALSDFLAPASRMAALEYMQHALSGQTPAAREEQLLRLDGRLIEVDTLSQPLIYQNKFALQTIARDLTARKQSETAGQQARALLEQVLTALPEALLVVEAESGRRITFCNAAAAALFGYAPEELLGLDSQALTEAPLFGAEGFSPQSALLTEKGVLFLPDLPLKRKDGRRFRGALRAFALTTPAGERLGWLSLIHEAPH